ncbi:MAG TPA: glycogen debranching N-terminal domain-containing protein, partial [Thermoanaerobaculia bacterium]
MRDSTLVRLNPRPETAYINQGRTVLATASNGFVEAHPDHGLFVHQTRLVSRLRWLVDGEPPVPNAMSNLEHDSWLGYYLLEAPGVPPPPRDTGSGQVPGISTQPIELRVSRRVGNGMHEEIEVTNFARERTTFRLTLEIDADFADAAETRGERIQKGKIKREITDDSLTLTYTVSINDRELERALRAVVRDSTTAPRITKSGIDFEIELSPHDSWQAAIDFIAIIEGTELAEGIRQDEKSPAPVKFTAPGSETLTPIVLETLRQAEYDLSALRLHDLDTPRGWTMAAGLPLYIALFGRDTLTSSWQAGLLGPEMMSGTLRRLQELQGSEENDWRDEQPGKMIHEAHDGPLAMLDVNPRRRNYGSITTSGLYSFIVAELWHWTGDESLVRPLLPAALASLQWLERYGDLDGDGFYEYLTRSSEGVRNQGWKDSADAIPYDDGRLVDPPIATCEEQGFVYVAKLHFADVLWWLGERDAAKRIFH